MEDFKRPNHTDFMTSSELSKIKFSGIRKNSISGCIEMWLEGEKKFEQLFALYEQDTTWWDKQYADLFGLLNAETVAKKGN